MCKFSVTLHRIKLYTKLFPSLIRAIIVFCRIDILYYNYFIFM